MPGSKGRILIIDDEKDIRFLLREILEDEDYDVAEAAHSEAAYAEIAARGMPDLVILDIWLENSDRDGMEILGDLKKRARTLPVLMISGHGNIEMAVKAIKLGAYDFIEKPFNSDRLLQLVGRAFETVHKASSKPGAAVPAGPIIAHSTAMQDVVKQAHKAAQGDARVLITGDWGTGRATLARHIHQDSARAAKPCAALSCTGLDGASLAEALSGEGSVILRDIQALSPVSQADLLARLNARPEARVMATALPGALDRARADGTFLPDLYERLAVVVIAMPRLEDRRADLPDLCAQFVSDAFRGWGEGDAPVRVHLQAQEQLRQMDFPGQGHRLRALCGLAALSMRADGAQEVQTRHLASDAAAAGDGPMAAWLKVDLRTAREAFERWYFESLMARFDDNVTQVAGFAGMDRTALYRKLKSIRIGGDGDEDAEAAA